MLAGLFKHVLYGPLQPGLYYQHVVKELLHKARCVESHRPTGEACWLAWTKGTGAGNRCVRVTVDCASEEGLQILIRWFDAGQRCHIARNRSAVCGEMVQTS